MSETICDALRESHETQRSLCRKLLRSKAGDRGWMATAKALSHKVHHHLAKKCRKDFARMQKSLRAG
jgi:hypothetical protein